MKINLKCEEAKMICTKSQYGAATWRDKINLNIHFVCCKVCWRFAKQNSKLSEICATIKKTTYSQSIQLTAEDKKKMKMNIECFENKS